MRDVLRAVSREALDKSEPSTRALGNRSAVNTAWFVPQPATQIFGCPGNMEFSQLPRLWLSMTASKSGSVTQSKAIGRHGYWNRSRFRSRHAQPEPREL